MFSFGVTDLQTSQKAPLPPTVAKDEDALKRNTDCIYFLASPLTCKKGNSCEYRHSEAARTNPRDCRFWKCGNCLNAHCSFRHLPLEGKPTPASVNPTSMAPTGVQLVSATSTTAAVGSNKSKTPCYFFSQGYCAKRDKCPFMHGLPVPSLLAEGADQQNPGSGVNGKSSHAGGRPSTVLQQSGLSPQEVRPVINGRPEASNGAHTISSMQKVPHGLQRVAHTERVANPDLARGSRQNSNIKKTLENQENLQVLAQAGDFKNQSRCQSEALWKVVPAGGGACQGLGWEEGEYSSPSGSRKSSKGHSNSSACNGWHSYDSYVESNGQRVKSKGDIRYHSTKRMKVNRKLNGIHPDLSTQRHRGGRSSDDHSTQKNQQQGGIIRNLVVEANSIMVKGTQLNEGRSNMTNEASEQSFKKGQLRNFALKQWKVNEPKAHKFEALPMPEKVLHASSCLSSKRPLSGTVKRENVTFTGPKSLAQIKAEKMARRESTSKAIGRVGSQSKSSLKLSGGKLADPAKSQDTVTSNEKVLSTCTGIVPTTKKDDGRKHEVAISEDFEGPKSLSTCLKRKRMSELGINVKEGMPGHTEEKTSAAKSFEEMEEGEIGDNDNNSNLDRLDDTDTPASSQEDFMVTSPSNAKIEVSEGLQRLAGEAAEFESELSDDGSKFDLEMEENAYGCEDYEMDDDDEDDFAKKLGRMFGFANE